MLRLIPLLDRINSVDPAQTVSDARNSVIRNIGRIQTVNEAQVAANHPAAAFLREVRQASELELSRSYRELLIVLAEKPDDPAALQAMELIEQGTVNSADISGVRSLARLAGSQVSGAMGVSVSDARTFLEIRINRYERALAAREGLSGELLSFVEEGLNKAVDEVRSSFREIVMVLVSRPDDETGIKALEIIASKSFTIKDKLAIRSLVYLAELGANPQSQEASSASLSARGP